MTLPDSLRDEKIAAAVGFAILGGLIGGLAANTFYNDSPLLVVTFAGFGAVAGYITGGKATD